MTSGRAAVYGAARPRASGFLRRRRRRGLQTTPPSRTDIRQQAALASFSGSPCRLDGLGVSLIRAPRPASSRPPSFRWRCRTRGPMHMSAPFVSRTHGKRETRPSRVSPAGTDRWSCDYTVLARILHPLQDSSSIQKQCSTRHLLRLQLKTSPKWQYLRHVPTFIRRS